LNSALLCFNIFLKQTFLSPAAGRRGMLHARRLSRLRLAARANILQTV